MSSTNSNDPFSKISELTFAALRLLHAVYLSRARKATSVHSSRPAREKKTFYCLFSGLRRENRKGTAMWVKVGTKTFGGRA